MISNQTITVLKEDANKTIWVNYFLSNNFQNHVICIS